MVKRLKPTEILPLRLQHQWLAEARRRKPAEIVAHFGAMQAQDFGMAKWAVGLRGAALSEMDVAAAFDAGEILRTHVLRPTWHFVTPEDIRSLLRLTSPRVRALMAYNDRLHGLDVARLNKTEKVIARALRAGKFLTREELQRELASHNLKLAGPGLANAIIHAELNELICSGPRRGNQFTYALLDKCAPRSVVPDRGVSLANLARRYFQSRGPATVRDFSWWSGLTMSDARAGIESLGNKFICATHDGCEYFLPADFKPAVGHEPLLLPNFDEYLVAYADRELMAWPGGPPPHGLRENPIFKNTIVLDGRIVGTWQRTLVGGELKIVLNLFAPLAPKARKALDHVTEQYRTFLTRPPKEKANQRTMSGGQRNAKRRLADPKDLS